MGKLDDLEAAADPGVSTAHLTTLASSPWWEVRARTASSLRLPSYALHRLGVDAHDKVSFAACLTVSQGSVKAIRAALKYNPALTRAVLNACAAFDHSTGRYAMPQANFDTVIRALHEHTPENFVLDVPREWILASLALE